MRADNNVDNCESLLVYTAAVPLCFRLYRVRFWNTDAIVHLSNCLI